MVYSGKRVLRLEGRDKVVMELGGHEGGEHTHTTQLVEAGICSSMPQQRR